MKTTRLSVQISDYDVSLSHKCYHYIGGAFGILEVLIALIEVLNHGSTRGKSHGRQVWS